MDERYVAAALLLILVALFFLLSNPPHQKSGPGSDMGQSKGPQSGGDAEPAQVPGETSGGIRPCGDGVCDEYEQANTGLCDMDCNY